MCGGQRFADLYKRGLSWRVSLKVSAACTRGDWQYFFKFPFLMVIFYICILACFLPRNIPMEEDLSCELVWNKLQKSADTFPCYLGSMLVKLEGWSTR